MFRFPWTGATQGPAPLKPADSIRFVELTADVYAVPQELLDFRAAIRQIAEERIAPRAAEIDATGDYPWDVRRLLAEHDVLGLPFAEEYGGTGTGTLML